MKRFFSTILIAVLAAFAFNSCESLDPEKDFSGTIYGFWVVDKLEVDASVTIAGTTHQNTSTIDFSKDYCRLNLDPSHIATLWYNLEFPDTEAFSYDESTKRIEFKKGLDKGDDGKAIVLLGIYDVELNGDQMIFRQPESAITIGNSGASNRNTYYFHRAPKSEKPKETAQE